MFFMIFLLQTDLAFLFWGAFSIRLRIKPLLISLFSWKRCCPWYITLKLIFQLYWSKTTTFQLYLSIYDGKKVFSGRTAYYAFDNSRIICNVDADAESRSRNRKIDFLQRQYEAVTDRSVHLSGYLWSCIHTALDRYPDCNRIGVVPPNLCITTLHITGSPSDYVLLADSLNLDTLQQFINFYGNWGPHKLVVHYRHHRKANAGFLDGSVRSSSQRELSEKGCPRYVY